MENQIIRFHRIALCLAFLGLLALPLIATAAEAPGGLSRGQMLYVPAYSHIYHGSTERPFLLAVTLSIRNIDPRHEMVVTVVDYYETAGAHLKHYIEAPVTLRPLETLRYVVPEKDKYGGSGASFIVRWKSDTPVNSPIVETVMIGTQVQQGISFTSRGRVVEPSP